MGSGGSSVYMTLAFAGVAMMAAAVVGIAVLRKRSNRQPHHQVKNTYTNIGALP